MLIVQKFGGSSLAELERLRRAAEICLEARRGEHGLVVVVSAAGDTTDDLTELARQIQPQPPPRELDALMATQLLGEPMTLVLGSKTLSVWWDATQTPIEATPLGPRVEAWDAPDLQYEVTYRFFTAE